MHWHGTTEGVSGPSLVATPNPHNLPACNRQHTTQVQHRIFATWPDFSRVEATRKRDGGKAEDSGVHLKAGWLAGGWNEGSRKREVAMGAAGGGNKEIERIWGNKIPSCWCNWKSILHLVPSNLN